VFEDDDGAAKIWLDEIGIDPKRFTRMGAKSNFWAMGDTGPCGPCTEIFYDHGPQIAGGPPGSPDEDGDRYVEIWNLVFMQFDRTADGTLTPLPEALRRYGHGSRAHRRRHAGRAQQLRHRPVPQPDRGGGKGDPHDDLASSSLRVIADHIRAASFLIADGVLPSNEGPRLRAAPDHPSRDPPRLHARPAQAVLSHARRHARAGDGRGLPELDDAACAHRARARQEEESGLPRR
jgi:alanyl-tRNA synthetase